MLHTYIVKSIDGPNRYPFLYQQEHPFPSPQQLRLRSLIIIDLYPNRGSHESLDSIDNDVLLCYTRLINRVIESQRQGYT